MRATGTITSWHDKRGYGFIAPDAGGERLFVHISAFRRRARRPSAGDVVTYTPSTDRKGRPCAEQAAIGVGMRVADPGRAPGVAAMVVFVAFFSFLGGAAVVASLPVAVPLLYLFVSGLTFVAYALDKSAARKGTRRTRELVLHLLALLGGWPGALIAQDRLRHKSAKRPFRILFWLTVAANCALLGWLMGVDNPFT